MTTKERLDELEKRILNLEMNLQTRLLKKGLPVYKQAPSKDQKKPAKKGKSK